MLQWNEIRQNFIRNVNELLWYNDMTEEMVENACGLPFGFFVEILCDDFDRKPSVEELENIAKYFGTTVEELCEHEPDSKTEVGYIVRHRRLVKVVTAEGCTVKQDDLA